MNVHVPETECPLTPEDMVELQATIAPLAPSIQYGIDLYERTLTFVSHKNHIML